MGLGLGSRCSSVFLLFRSGGWVGGEMEIKANLSLRLDEVEAELSNCFSFHCNLLISTIILQLQINQRQLPTNMQISNDFDLCFIFFLAVFA